MKWKSLTGELFDICCSRSGIFSWKTALYFIVYEAETYNWRDLRYFMSTKLKTLTEELDNIS